jgi:RNA 2',3'-cyclic 3'-phosphodiesterase
MDAQYSLPGIGPAPEPTDRFFFALLPEPGLIRQLGVLAARFADRFDGELAPTPAHRFHVSLQHLGNHVGVPVELIRRALRAASHLSFHAFETRFDRVMMFSGRSARPGNRALALVDDEASKIVEFDASLAEALRHQGLNARALPFTAHVTLGYAPLRLFECEVPPVIWPVREFALVHRRIGRGLPYRLLGRWQLGQSRECTYHARPAELAAGCAPPIGLADNNNGTDL